MISTCLGLERKAFVSALMKLYNTDIISKGGERWGREKKRERERMNMSKGQQYNVDGLLCHIIIIYFKFTVFLIIRDTFTSEIIISISCECLIDYFQHWPHLL